MTKIWVLLACFALAACQTASGSSARTPASHLQKKAITFQSGDGTELSGYLYKPQGDGPFDTVLMMHGCAGMLDRGGSIKPREAAWLEILREEG